MKLDVLSDAFGDAVKIAARFSGERSYQPMIHLYTHDGQLMVAGTDYNRGYVGTVRAAIEEPGGVLVHGSTLKAITSRMPEGRMTLATDGDRLVLRSGAARAPIRQVAGAYPSLDGEGAAYNVNAEKFKLALSWTLHAAFRHDHRPALHSICLEVSDGLLTLMAADGYRGAFAPAGETDLPNGEYLVPLTLATDLYRLIDEKLEIQLLAGRIFFKGEQYTLTGSLVAGKFPALRQLMPKESNVKMVVDSESLSKGLDLCSVLARDNENRLTLKAGGGQILLRTVSQQRGETETEVSFSVLEGEGEALLALPFLQQIPAFSAQMVIRFSPGQAIVCYPESLPDFVAMISPMI